MIETLDLTKFKTGLELEEEFNRIIQLALDYKLSHVTAQDLLTEIYDYGRKSGKFPLEDHKNYMKRKNKFHDRERTHLEMAMNIKQCQDREHKAFLYFVEWSKERYPDKKIEWEYNGSDAQGYIMIVNEKLRKTFEPDYKISIGDNVSLIEVKTFFIPPTFKIRNIIKYRRFKENTCYMVFKHKSKYYLTGYNGMGEILKLPKRYEWDQNTVVMSEENINNFLEKNWIMEFSNA